MIFGRSESIGWYRRLRAALWPTRGLKRSVKYVVKRLARLSSSPHAIAVGVASGVACSFTPFLGFHFLLAILLAKILRGNILAAMLGTFVGNPVTFPFIFASTYKAGKYLLSFGEVHARELADVEEKGEAIAGRWIFTSGFEAVWPVVKTMAVGAIPLGALAFLICYFAARGFLASIANRGRSPR